MTNQYLYDTTNYQNQDKKQIKVHQKICTKKSVTYFLRRLQNLGIPIHNRMGLMKPAHSQLLAEVSNFAAKTFDEEFYNAKAIFILDSILKGAEGGWSSETEGLLYIYTPQLGTATFHDPHGKIFHTLKKSNITLPYWPYPWHRVRRQIHAISMFEKPGLIKEIASITQKGHVATPEEQANLHQYLSTI
jgi:hypothetical protein